MEHSTQATRRLLSDLKELQKSPIEGVSAAPLEENMFEWHCNFVGPKGSDWEGAIFHVILFFPDTYPAVSPSAEFVPKAFQPIGGAVKAGKKGNQVCLSIFSDFAKVHTEWANEKGTGWSSSYTVQTVLLNLVSFLNEMTRGGYNSTMKENVKVSNAFTCPDCNHTSSKPHPPLPTSKDLAKGKEETHSVLDALTCYVTKIPFKEGETSEIYGFGIAKTGNERNPSLTSPCEVMTLGGFQTLKKNGKVESVMREEIHYFLPLIISSEHGGRIKKVFEDSCCHITGTRDFEPKLILQVIPKLMNSTVVSFMNGTTHTSERSLQGYFMFHRLFIWTLEKYPSLLPYINQLVKSFVEDTNSRLKSVVPNVGEWLTYLTVCTNCTWKNASIAYLTENFDRNVMWYLKENPSLSAVDDSVSPATRLSETFRLTAVSRNLCVFQVLFMDVARPEGLSIPQIIERYDKNYGLPTPEMEKEMKEVVQKIKGIADYPQWFAAIKVPYPGTDKFNNILKSSITNASKKEGYTFKQGGGGGGGRGGNRGGRGGGRRGGY